MPLNSGDNSVKDYYLVFKFLTLDLDAETSQRFYVTTCCAASGSLAEPGVGSGQITIPIAQAVR